MPGASDLRAAERLALKAANEAYRHAIAAQLAGRNAAPYWREFEAAMQPLYGSAWARGAARILRTRGLPQTGGVKDLRDMVREVAAGVEAWSPDETPPVALLPFAPAAAETAAHEAVHAVEDMADQSPDFAALVNWVPVKGVTPAQQRGLHKLVVEAVDRGSPAPGRPQLESLGLGEFTVRAQSSLAVNLTDARLENVLRTSMATQRTGAETQVLKDETVRVFVPLLSWSAIKDPPRVRPTHLAMHGYVNTVDAYERFRLGPPAGFQCRCSRIPVPLADALDRGWVRADGSLVQAAIDRHNGARQRLIDSGQFPDPGFNT